MQTGRIIISHLPLHQLIQADAIIKWNGDTKAEGRIMGEAHPSWHPLFRFGPFVFGDVPLLLTPSEAVSRVLGEGCLSGYL